MTGESKIKESHFTAQTLVWSGEEHPMIPEELKVQTKRRAFSGIQGKLVILILLVLIPLLVSQAYFFYDRYQYRRGVELQANLEVARATAKAFDAFVQNVLHHELAIGIAATASPPLSEEGLHRLLEQSAKAIPAVRDFFWFSSQGRILASSTPEALGMDGSDRPWFKEITAGREWMITDLIRSKLTGDPSIAICRGILDDRGKLLGITVAAIIPTKLDSVLAIERSREAGVSLVDSKGVHVYRYPHTEYTWEQRDWLKMYPVIEDSLRGREVVTTVTSGSSGKRRIVGFTPISSIGWVAAASRAEEAALEPIISAILNEVAIILLIALTSLFASFGLARTISASVKNLKNQALAVSCGQMECSFPVSGPAELKELGHTFLLMAQRVQSRENALFASEQRYRQLFENMTEGFALGEPILDENGIAYDFRFIEINAAFERQSGLTRDILGKPITEVLRQLEPCWIETYCQVALTGKPTRFENYNKDLDKHFHVYCYRPMERCFAILFWDITERKYSEDAVRTGAERLSIAKDAAGLGIYDYDIASGIIQWDERAGELWGVGPDTLVTYDLFLSGLHPDDRAPTQAAVERALDPKGNGEYKAEYRVISLRDGVERWVAATGKVFFCNEQPERLVGTVQDITEQKHMEEELRNSRDELELRVRERTVELEAYMKKLQESNQALQDFASIASHDLQEPLRKVASFGNMLKQRYGDGLGEGGKDYLSRMLGATERMNSLLTSLLEYSRVTTKSEPFKEVDLSLVVREVLSDLEVRIASTGAEVHIDDLPMIKADPTQMRQLFQNLIGNAVKFHKEGEAPIVQVHGSPDGKGCHEIAVEDNGIGFEEQYLERIFAPFQRLHGRSSSYEGTGMGLAICKKIVERHRGSITARSKPGRGSAFIIRLPGTITSATSHEC